MTASNSGRDKSFWFLQISGWLFVFYLIYAQGISAFDYELGVSMGMQDSAEEVTDVGVAFWRGFAVADVVAYIPLFALGLIGHFRAKNWGRAILAGALGMTIYWPIVCLVAVLVAQESELWTANIPGIYFIVLPAFVLWSLWGIWQIIRELNIISN